MQYVVVVCCMVNWWTGIVGDCTCLCLTNIMTVIIKSQLVYLTIKLVCMSPKVRA